MKKFMNKPIMMYNMKDCIKFGAVVTAIGIAVAYGTHVYSEYLDYRKAKKKELEEKVVVE